VPLIDDAYIACLKALLPEEGAAAGCTAAGGPSGPGTGGPEAPEVAFRRIERLASFRERSTQELRQRLEREGFDADAAEGALARAQACGLVDDVRFAEVLVRSRMSAGMGRQGIGFELERLGIDPGDIPGWSGADPADEESDELDRALGFLERKPPPSKNKRDGAYRKLLGKGYASPVASKAARIWSENLE